MRSTFPSVVPSALCVLSQGCTSAPCPFPGRLRPRHWPRHGVVAFSKRPKSPVQLDDPGAAASTSASSHQPAPARGQRRVVDDSTGTLPLKDDRYQLPRPKASTVRADSIFTKQQESRGNAHNKKPVTVQPPKRQGGTASPGSEHRDGFREDGSGSGSPNEGGVGPNPPQAAGDGEGDSEDAVELVFKLERRGEGWGEELFPHVVVEKRPLFTKSKHKCQHPDPWEEGSLELYLIEVGVPPQDVDRVVEQAVAWRFTPGGRALIDRRRRSRVERNVRLVVQHLEMEGGIPFGPKGMGAILARVPEIMLCKPTTNDRWDRRAVELVAFQHLHGHCNVPEDWAPNPELGAWVKRQRVARAAGQLSDDRMAILQGLGFEFGEVAQMTEEWELRFDQLIDWMLWHRENQQRFSWLGSDWGHRGGITARELALWVRLQGEFRRRNLLPAEALKRFEAIGVEWDSQDGSPSERQWMQQFSRLLYVIERHNTVSRPYLLQTARLGRPRSGAEEEGEGEREGEGGYRRARRKGAVDDDDDSDDELYPKPSSSVALRGRAKLQQELAARRQALAVADLRCEAGLRYWLERQRWLWRQGRLPSEQVLMLQLAGVDMEGYTAAEWQQEAHAAAALLQGSGVRMASAAPAPEAAADAGRGEPGSGRSRGRAATPLPVPEGGGGRVGGCQSAIVPKTRLVPPQPPQEGARHAGAAASAGTRHMPLGRPYASASGRGGTEGGAAPLRDLEGELGGGAPRGAEEGRGGGGSTRLRVRRWVQTQAALFHEGHLSPAQLRYLAFLGVTWVVSDEVMHMGEGAWRARFEQLVAVCKEAAAEGVPPAAAAAVVAGRELREWLRHQRGLQALGLLREDRRRLLGALGVGWGHPRGEAERGWDSRLSQLLAFKSEHGHLEVPMGEGPYPDLAAWLDAQRRLMAVEGGLDPGHAAQLAAIGVTPVPPGGGSQLAPTRGAFP